MKVERTTYDDIHEFSKVLRENCEKANSIKNEWGQNFQGIRLVAFEEVLVPHNGRYYQITDIFMRTWDPEIFTYECLFEDFWEIKEFLEDNPCVEIMFIWNEHD